MDFDRCDKNFQLSCLHLQDLLSVLIEGPERTPYQDGLFAFDVYLPQQYPSSPPSVHYVSYSPRLNPNLYEMGRVCVSLLGTWSGKGSEKWTKDSTLLQVLLSIQGKENRDVMNLLLYSL